jgi:hypothetical protein
MLKWATATAMVLLGAFGLAALLSALTQNLEAAVPMVDKTLGPVQQTMSAGHFASADILTMVVGAAMLSVVAVFGFVYQRQAHQRELERVTAQIERSDFSEYPSRWSQQMELFKARVLVAPDWARNILSREHWIRLGEKHKDFGIYALMSA